MSNLIRGELTQNELKWQDDLVKKVRSVLEQIVQPPNLVDFMLSNENVFKYLVPAFTHETYNPNINFHGQRLEYLGDRSLKSIFSDYMYSRFPTIDESAFTEFENAYMSNKYQAGLSDKLGISEYIRAKGYESIELSLKADVFESFCAFLVRAGNSISGDNASYGLGFNFLRNFVIYLFNDVEFDMDRAAGSPKTRFDQLFGVKGSVRTHLNDDGTTRVEVILDDSKIRSIEGKDADLARSIKQYLAQTLKSNVIGSGTSRSDKVADRIAFDSAMETLRKAGLTNEKYQTIKRNAKLASVSRTKLNKLNLRIKELGYTTFNVNDIKPKEDDDSPTKVWQLYAIDSNGVRQNLLSLALPREMGSANAIDKLIDKYLRTESLIETPVQRDVTLPEFRPPAQRPLPKPLPEETGPIATPVAGALSSTDKEFVASSYRYEGPPSSIPPNLLSSGSIEEGEKITTGAVKSPLEPISPTSSIPSVPPTPPNLLSSAGGAAESEEIPSSEMRGGSPASSVSPLPPAPSVSPLPSVPPTSVSPAPLPIKSSAQETSSLPPKRKPPARAPPAPLPTKSGSRGPPPRISRAPIASNKAPPLPSKKIPSRRPPVPTNNRSKQ